MKQNFFVFLAAALLSAGCATAQSAASAADELDKTIREASDYVNKNVPRGSKLVILNIKSDYPPLSEYIIDVLTENVVNDRLFTVVDRANLTLIQQEMNFQLSGEVSDESAQSIGQKLGAQTIVSGSITPFGNLWRLTIRSLGVEDATIQGMFNRNIPGSISIAALTSNGPVAAATVVTVTTSPAPAVSTSPALVQVVPAQTSTPAPDTVPAEPLAPVVYKIGERGPAGGWIFYDKGVFTNGWQYMEAVPGEMEFRAQWGRDIDVATGTAVGSGKANTQRIDTALQRRGDLGTAAQDCTELNINGYTDWFLPSQGELNLMYINLKEKGIGGFGNNWYWSSSQVDSRRAWRQNFAGGQQDNHIYSSTKNNTYSVRAVRAF